MSDGGGGGGNSQRLLSALDQDQLYILEHPLLPTVLEALDDTTGDLLPYKPSPDMDLARDIDASTTDALLVLLQDLTDDRKQVRNLLNSAKRHADRIVANMSVPDVRSSRDGDGSSDDD